ncbi:MAG: hypothetical protein WAO35_16120 [Terriglobia bacterium]
MKNQEESEGILSKLGPRQALEELEEQFKEENHNNCDGDINVDPVITEIVLFELGKFSGVCVEEKSPVGIVDLSLWVP